ncbi:MAG: ECF transporter S component [candidate division KSB1 bacterium]|nr:ECF transporter S component [candidate division KSB1 bacterium]MDZ7319026.1 ECF transporter S component [candidate division KSB1 bacterium]MDZ7341443.1 ECF transporter S component [candidate division KSB1 bacterium]
MLRKISTFDGVFIALMAACGLALKPIVGPLFKLIGSALFISGGSMAGFIYMIWPMLAVLVVGRFGAATLVGLIQGAVILVTGIYGSHGVLTLITYTVPGLVVDIFYQLIRHWQNPWVITVPAAMGNLSGNLLVSILILHLPRIPLLISIIPAVIFGGLGGYLSWLLYNWLLAIFPIFSPAKSNDSTLEH